MNHVRMQLSLTTRTEMLKFMLAVTGETDTFIMENFNGSYRTSAQSILGMFDLVANCGGEVYLYNETNDGVFPVWTEEFRAA